MVERSSKICPLMDKGFCEKEKCAWWINEVNLCAVVGLAQALDYQAGTVRDILNYSATPEKFKHL